METRNHLTALVCEYDIGQDNTVFPNKRTATRWAESALKNAGVDETFEELRAVGLIDFRDVHYVA